MRPQLSVPAGLGHLLESIADMHTFHVCAEEEEGGHSCMDMVIHFIGGRTQANYCQIGRRVLSRSYAER